MKYLSDILYKAGAIQIIGSTQARIAGITADSRKVSEGWLFVAIKGTQTDGNDYIKPAIEQGAIAIVTDQNLPESIHAHCTYVTVKQAAYALGILAANYYNNPSQSLKLVGVTGTNGKTTVATLLYHLFSKLGYACGLISTVTNLIKGQVIEATHTTPDHVSLQQLLSKMLEQGCTHVFMEVSSHAAHQQRIAGLHFTGALFTNLTHDHLDYHGSFANYRDAKKMFFDNLPPTAFAITNKDDKNGMVMLQNTAAKTLTYALKANADYRAKIMENNLAGLVLQIHNQEVHFRLAGKFNAYNLCLVFATAVELGIEPTAALMHLSAIEPVNGRFELLRAPNGLMAVVDYAHTPDALQNILETLKESLNGSGNLITVVGCGGNRDKAKRPLMARLAASLSYRTIFTADNPRWEDPKTIIEDMVNGLDIAQRIKTLQITDRQEAIKAAILMAQPHDLVLVAGKGHETYQEIAGVKHAFDDKAIILSIFKSFNV